MNVTPVRESITRILERIAYPDIWINVGDVNPKGMRRAKIRTRWRQIKPFIVYSFGFVCGWVLMGLIR